MRRVVFVMVLLAFAGGAAAQTYRSRAPRFERQVRERLRLGPYAGDRALVFPCQPAGQGCASNPLAVGRVVFEGPAGAWDDFELCRQVGVAVMCVPVVRAFGATWR